MKNFIFVIGISFFHLCSYSQETGILKDARDGHIYKTIKIGSRVYMADNLAYIPVVSPSSKGSKTAKHFYVYGYEGTDVKEAKATDNYKLYGVLYNQPAALNACPTGWHLPSEAEWQVLIDFLTPDAGYKMKTTAGWDYDGNGDNSSGFSALPGGRKRAGGGAFGVVGGELTSAGFSGLGTGANFWLATDGQARTFYDDSKSVHSEFTFRDIGFSVRCIKN